MPKYANPGWKFEIPRLLATYDNKRATAQRGGIAMLVL
jgi:hypothetical protein